MPAKQTFNTCAIWQNATYETAKQLMGKNYNGFYY